MVTFELDNTSPNQYFTIVESGHSIGIKLQTSYEMLFASVDIDEVAVSTSVRCVNNKPIIPYRAYAPKDIGNIFFYCSDDEYPDYKNFNSSCIIVYMTPEEMKERGML